MLEDYKTLRFQGQSGTKTISLSEQDKGHGREFQEVVKAVRGENSSVITFPESVAAMELAFSVEKALRSTAD